MILVDVDAATVARTRVAVSPLAEVVTSLRLAATGGSDRRYDSLVRQTRRALSDPDVDLVASVMPQTGHGYFPDLLTPSPMLGTDVLAAQLEAVAATPEQTVLDQVEESRIRGLLGADLGVRPRSREVLVALDRGTYATRAAAGLARLWRQVFRDDWPSLLRVLTADLEYRATQTVNGGVAGMVDGLHPTIDLDPGQLRITASCEARASLTDGTITLSPALLGGPHLGLSMDTPDELTVRYPARSESCPSGRRPAERIERLMGATRAAILESLRQPSTSGEIARDRHISPATASYHLGVLYDAGLVHRERTGMSVVYSRSERGRAVVDGLGA